MDIRTDSNSGRDYIERSGFLQKETGHSKTVAKRLHEEGKYNIQDKPPSRTLWQIISSNTFTIFNAIIIGLSITMITFSFYKESLFVVPVILNIFTGIIQEYQAKKKIEAMGLLQESEIDVIRDGERIRLHFEDIVQDDVLFLTQGMQMPVDLVYIGTSTIDVDEALLTGESDPVAKKYGDVLYAGSFIVAGSGIAQAFRIGHETYISHLSDEARKFKVVKSELRESTNAIIKTIAWIMIVTGPLVIWSNLDLYSLRQAIYNITPGIVGMVPEGLVLLTTVTLMLGVVKMSEERTLVQEMAAIETLARVDVLCLDKTGTITEGNFDVVDVVSVCQQTDVEYALKELVVHDEDRNATAEAIYEAIKHRDEMSIFTNITSFEKEWKLIKMIPFSSSRKWSGMYFENEGTWIIGAPEFTIQKQNHEKEFADITKYAKEGYRVIAISHTPDEVDRELPNNITLKGYVLLQDRIRKEAPDTFAYFHSQDVSLKVISGDNPDTVLAVAKRAGLGDDIQAIDARNLPDDLEKLGQYLETYTVFGRVSPHQKKMMVQALQAKGHVVGMTGDGVNDVLALKEADCAIAMNNGSEASKAVSQFVLLDSNFAVLPEAVNQGRRAINNIQSVASIFLVKNLYSIFFIVLTILTYLYSRLFLDHSIVLGYPYDPMYFSLISAVSIGYPATLLALLPNKERVSGSIIQNVIKVAVPSSVMITLGIVIFWILQGQAILFTKSNYAETITQNPGLLQFQFSAMIFTVLMQFYAVIRSSLPFTKWKFLIIAANIMIFIAGFNIPIVSEFLNISRAMPHVSLQHYLVPIGMAIIGMAFSYVFEQQMQRFFQKREKKTL